MCISPGWGNVSTDLRYSVRKACFGDGVDEPDRTLPSAHHSTRSVQTTIRLGDLSAGQPPCHCAFDQNVSDASEGSDSFSQGGKSFGIAFDRLESGQKPWASFADAEDSCERPPEERDFSGVRDGLAPLVLCIASNPELPGLASRPAHRHSDCHQVLQALRNERRLLLALGRSNNVLAAYDATIARSDRGGRRLREKCRFPLQMPRVLTE